MTKLDIFEEHFSLKNEKISQPKPKKYSFFLSLIYGKIEK